MKKDSQNSNSLEKKGSRLDWKEKEPADRNLIFGLTNLMVNSTKEYSKESTLEESIKERE